MAHDEKNDETLRLLNELKKQWQQRKTDSEDARLNELQLYGPRNSVLMVAIFRTA